MVTWLESIKHILQTSVKVLLDNPPNVLLREKHFPNQARTIVPRG